MSKQERGFSTIEVIVVIGLAALIALGSSYAIFQIFNTSAMTQSSMTPLVQIETVGYWLTRDTQMAESITSQDLPSGQLVMMTWTEFVLNEDSVYHSVTYYFENPIDGVYDLKRYHWSSAGADDTTLIGRYLYYDMDDPSNTTAASYNNPTLSLRLVSSYGSNTETREYKISRRLDY